MRIQFQILIFFVFFNIAVFFIATTGFFPPGTTLYGDTTTFDVDDPEYDINNPDKLPTPDEMFTRLITNSVTKKVAGFHIGVFSIELTYGILMIGIVGLSIAIGLATRTSNGVSLLIVGLMFTVMWANSNTIIDKAIKGLDSSVNYLVLMFLLGVMISFIILLYDTASGQKSTK